MSTINVKKTIEQWDAHTFEEWIDRVSWSDEITIKELRSQLKTLGLSEKKMNGYSVMGLERSQEGLGGGVSYTETFFKIVEETKKCNLIDYLYSIVYQAMQQGYSGAKIGGIIARGMRTFASLLRDHDFAFKIEQEFKQHKLSDDFKVSNGSAEDAKNHTDVLVTSDKNDYRIWLFQFTKMGLPHNIERLTEQRGVLPKGVHILCPLKSEYQMDLEIVSKRIKTLSEKLDEWKSKEKTMNEGTKALQDIRDRIKKNTHKLNLYTEKKTELIKLLDGNIEPYHGWYLYGNKTITETLNTIVDIDQGNIKPKLYTDVYNMLNAPREYLSNLSSFEI